MGSIRKNFEANTIFLITYIVGTLLGTVVGSIFGIWHRNRTYWIHVPFILVSELAMFYAFRAFGTLDDPQGDSALTAWLRQKGLGEGATETEFWLFGLYILVAVALRIGVPIYLIRRGIKQSRLSKESAQI